MNYRATLQLDGVVIQVKLFLKAIRYFIIEDPPEMPQVFFIGAIDIFVLTYFIAEEMQKYYGQICILELCHT